MPRLSRVTSECAGQLCFVKSFISFHKQGMFTSSDVITGRGMLCVCVCVCVCGDHDHNILWGGGGG